MYTYEKYENISPQTRANCFSKLFFCWILPYFKYGHMKELQMKDVYNTTKENLSETLGDKLEKNWEKELKYSQAKGISPSLSKAIMKTFWKSYLSFSFWMTIQVVLLKTLQPVVLSEYIKYFQIPVEERRVELGWIWGGLVVFLPLLNTMIYHHYWFGCQSVGMRMRIACSSLLYRKLLKLNQGSLGKTSSGQMVNLLTNDVQKLEDIAIYLIYLYLTPLQFATAVYVFYVTVGIAFFPGLAVMLWQAVPVQGCLSKIQGKLRLKIANLTDSRIKLISEVVTGIQVIKMYAWETPFQNMINKVRKHELNVIMRSAYIKGYFAASVVFTERLCVFASTLTHVLLGHKVTGDVVFCLAQLYNILQNAMCFYFPLALIAYVESKVSIRRMEEFLALDKKEDKLEKVVYEKGLGMVTLFNVSASWNSTVTLKNITLAISPGSLVCVLGNVGSGKSSLLQVLLEELPVTVGHVNISGKISYTSQKPWLFVSSVRQNILFGEEYKENKYKEVVRVCDLEKDFLQFPFGDQTLVGERGVSLSGGQRARINLARALYRDADIYLFDDPLSAVDSRVNKHLFEEGILNYLRNKTRILVTHQLQFSQQADLVIIMNKGEIAHVATREEISKNMDLNDLKELKEETITTTEDVRERSDEIGKPLNNESFENISEIDSQTNEEKLNKKVSASTYKKYFLSGTHFCVVLFLMFILVVAQISANITDLWITYWTNVENIHFETTKSETFYNLVNLYNFTVNTTQEEFSSANQSEFKLNLRNSGNTNYDLNQGKYQEDFFYIYVYCGTVVACVFLTTLRSFVFYKVCMNASQAHHKTMLGSILRAPMRFFDLNPSGRIMNRFSKDMGTVDESLPYNMVCSIQMCLVMIGITVVLIILIPWIVAVMILLGLVVYYFAVGYLNTVQKVKALEGNARSPVYSHVATTWFGITTIRASGKEDLLKKEFDFLQDQHTGTWYLYMTCSQAFGFYLDIIVTLFLAVVTFKFLVFKEETSLSGYVGLAITQAAVLNGLLQAGIRCSTEVVSNMVSVERIFQYTNIEKEETIRCSKVTILPKDWPHSGKVIFKNASLRYVSTDPAVLKQVDVTINPGEKIGIVGRTGAGKSSLIAALFRLAPIEGQIIIDDVDTATIDLEHLRSNISIIPQEPILFSTTIRYNLDPFGKTADEVLWGVLEKVELKDTIKDLNQGVSEGGANFSAGQRQLICLARAIVRENKIIVMDEATANVDPQTDSLIQATIRKYFQKCTVLTIAHRLNTVMDSDKILVMDYGRVVEYGHAHDLLSQPNGYFTKMVKETGSKTEDYLRRIAFEDFQKKYTVK